MHADVTGDAEMEAAAADEGSSIVPISPVSPQVALKKKKKKRLAAAMAETEMAAAGTEQTGIEAAETEQTGIEAEQCAQGGGMVDVAQTAEQTPTKHRKRHATVAAAAEAESAAGMNTKTPDYIPLTPTSIASASLHGAASSAEHLPSKKKGKRVSFL